MCALYSPLIVIAGDGTAASALACQLLDSGYRVAIAPRAHPHPPLPIIEALPNEAVHLFAEIGLGQALSASDPLTVDGFDNHFHDTPRTVEGTWTNVNRSALAQQCLRAARDRGAQVLRHHQHTPANPLAVVDATGRAARHSRPIQRSRPATATIFTAPPRPRPRPGRVIRTASGWAYRIDHSTATTVGVVTDRHPASTLHPHVAELLDIDSSTTVRHSIRNCSVQWSDNPIGPRRIAIGDAALALNPLAGQGIRFALASTLAAAAILRTWVDGNHAPYIDEYYRTFVAGARDRHLTNLTTMLDGPPTPPDPPHHLDPRTPVSFNAIATTVGQNRGGRIVAAPAFQLPDGGFIRYVGGIDLMKLRAATTPGATLADVHHSMARITGTRTASTLLSWALDQRLLTTSNDR